MGLLKEKLQVEVEQNCGRMLWVQEYIKQSSEEERKEERKENKKGGMQLKHLPTVCLNFCQHQSLQSKSLTFPLLVLSSGDFYRVYNCFYFEVSAFFFHQLINNF